MKNKLINLYETVTILAFVLSVVALVAMIVVGVIDTIDETTRQKIEVQSTYVKDTFYDKTQQAVFDLSDKIEKEQYQDYYVKGKDLTTNKPVELPISKDIYDNINSLKIKKIVYESKERVKVYNENYSSDFDKLVKDHGHYVLIAFLISSVSLWFITRKDNDLIEHDKLKLI